MNEQNRAFPTAVVLSLTTGRLLCDFGNMQECAEYLTGSGVWTHQFAHRPFNDELRAAIYAQHPELADVDASDVTTENWQRYRDHWVRRFGETLTLTPMATVKTRGESFSKPLEGKPLLAASPSKGPTP